MVPRARRPGPEDTSRRHVPVQFTTNKYNGVAAILRLIGQRQQFPRTGQI